VNRSHIDKLAANIFRYNTFRDVAATLTLRHGNDNRVEATSFSVMTRNNWGESASSPSGKRCQQLHRQCSEHRAAARRDSDIGRACQLRQQ